MQMNNHPSPQFLRHVVQWLRAVADESRVRLLLRLKQGEANVSTLVTELAMPQATVSKHLGVLRSVGIVRSRREGTAVIYSISDPAIFQVCELVCGEVRRHHAESAAAFSASDLTFSNKE